MREQEGRIRALEGKTIQYTNGRGETFNGLIANCDADVGLTVVKVDDVNQYLFCMRGPSSPKNMANNKATDIEWEIALKIIIPMLESGSFVLLEFERELFEAIPEMEARLVTAASSLSCAFAQ